jgi:uncharacterized protein
MRLPPKQANHLLEHIKAVSPEAQVFLFGSRIDDAARGGDIDLCILSEGKISLENLSRIRIAFFKAFGYRKLDLVNYLWDENSTFRQVIMADAIPLESSYDRS